MTKPGLKVNNQIIDWNSLSKAEKDAIEEGLKDAQENRCISEVEFYKKYSKWFKQPVVD